MRQIILDTETTGLSPLHGHRIIEIGCVELINRRLSGKTYQTYLQPQRDIDAGATAVHGITNAFLKGKPLFADIVDEFKAFIVGAELIIHNAPFDVGFIENEFLLLKDEWQVLEKYCQITDTLAFARSKHPGQRNNLDALCKRYNINNQHREKHGALLDAHILAEVYLAMTGGQHTLVLDENNQEAKDFAPISSHQSNINVPLILASNEELAKHKAMLANIEKKTGAKTLWEEVDKV